MRLDRVFAATGILALLMGALPTPASAQVTLVLGETGVDASGMTAGGSVVLVCAAHVRPNVLIKPIRREVVLVDTDRDGIVHWEFGGPLPIHSVWGAVDLTTGHRAVAAHPQGPNSPMSLPDPNSAGGGALASSVAVRGGFVALLLVRPGRGAWIGSCFDGASEDREPENRRVVGVPVSTLQRLGASVEAPAQLQVGDVVLGFELDSLQYFSGRIGGEI